MIYFFQEMFKIYPNSALTALYCTFLHLEKNSALFSKKCRILHHLATLISVKLSFQEIFRLVPVNLKLLLIMRYTSDAPSFS